jgi:hypothetical protein
MVKKLLIAAVAQKIMHEKHQVKYELHSEECFIILLEIGSTPEIIVYFPENKISLHLPMVRSRIVSMVIVALEDSMECPLSKEAL